ncbi:2-dehydropantoate 2-reductase [Halalkalibacter lacteus]|uniref:2-dehydropantoate 2-reductase n=1 Tax=Halalkalibacter lacteus TaxID=3090663 RepID=UPI002FCA31C1
MKIVIVGSGSIGLLVTFYLASHQHAIVLATNRKDQVDVIKEKGVHVVRHNQTARMNVSVSTFSDMKWDETIDLLIVAVKSYQVTSVLKKVHSAKVKSILFLQNGMGHTEIFSKLAIPELAVGVIEHGALRKNDYTVHHTGVGRVRWSYVRESSGVVNEILKGIIDPNFPVKQEQDWFSMLEGKLVVNACINPITALLQVENGELVKSEHYLSMMKLVFNEVISVVGCTNDAEMWKYVCHVCEKTANNRSSMFVDIVNNRKTEIDSIVGYLIRRARDQKKFMPILTFLYEGIRAKEIEQWGDCS